MPSVVYSGTFGGYEAGANGRDIPVTGTPIPAGATITGITFTLDISADNYSSSNEWNLLWFAIGSASGSPYAAAQFATMYSNKHTFSGNMNFSASDVNKFTGGQFTLYAKANTDHSARSYMGAFTITVHYVTYSKCTEPSGVKLSSAVSTGSNVTLSWEAGKGGNDNAISHYQIARKLSTDGSTWGSLETVGTTTALSLSVAPPAAFGAQYRYYVRTVGTAGTSYASAWAACSEVLQKVRPALTVYTDATITAGETPVKAVHMEELQSNINALRQGLGLAAYSFTAIRAGYTSLAGWNDHIREMREAVDGITTGHEAWLTLEENRPRADVLMQLRRVVAAI